MNLHTVECVELHVGGDNGWAVPSAKNDQVYDDWASSNRFQVNDTLRFEYEKDSVLVVTEEEYEKCRSTHPIFFYNNGDTVFTLDRPGLFYFVSGVAGHCQRGLKMIVKVLDPQSPGHLSIRPPTKTAAATTLVFAAPQLIAAFDFPICRSLFC
ncbi:early nodulin-like protein 1 [Phtheirospermum japonicum]|uniref:Early nodulin-like protein 1 n=1 Tax=Phtheirospermum japonicum TaxID=374723 RepID=A0A830CEE8_9LAMI|nr:early nodulin-like protein 1 [Phtheirospermum japonicum]